MTRNFAKTRNKKTMTLAKSQGKVLTFIVGFIAGTLTTYLLYTWQSQESSTPVQHEQIHPAPETGQEKEKLDFTFQDLFPIDEVKTISGYEQTNPESEDFNFLLQTGSFKSNRDADERRAEILLLGLDAFIQSTEINGVNWHRVMVGPFSDRQSLSRAQDLLAVNQFEAMPRRAKP